MKGEQKHQKFTKIRTSKFYKISGLKPTVIMFYSQHIIPLKAFQESSENQIRDYNQD